MLRSENMVPNTSFASSFALNRAGRARAGPISNGGAFNEPESDTGRPFVWPGPAIELGFSCCRAHSLLYIHSAAVMLEITYIHKIADLTMPIEDIKGVDCHYVVVNE